MNNKGPTSEQIRNTHRSLSSPTRAYCVYSRGKHEEQKEDKGRQQEEERWAYDRIVLSRYRDLELIPVFGGRFQIMTFSVYLPAH